MADVAEGGDAIANARAKATAVAERAGVPEGGGVLGADTEVLLEGRALGKPADRNAAARMLGMLGDRSHTVVTALALVAGSSVTEARAEATVRFRALPDRLTEWYLATGEWRDRAGGYAIQGAGAALVEAVDGEPGTVIGLPLGALGRLLESEGLAPWLESRSA